MSELIAVLAPLRAVPLELWLIAATLSLVLGILVYELRRTRARRRNAGPSGNAELEALRRFLSTSRFPYLDSIPLVGREVRNVVMVDLVAKLPASIAIILLGPQGAEGRITVREGGAIWELKSGGKPIFIANPSLQLTPVVRAFRKRFPLVRVRGFLVMPDGCELPPSSPKNITTVSKLCKTLEQMREQDGVDSAATEHAWTKITDWSRDMRARASAARYGAAV
ncbi:MAG TPA: hypothetical protein VEY95_06065 [Azospirillaceae bacterium]|nr:hypothetical protein [Azospirillaceae bacterium]